MASKCAAAIKTAEDSVQTLRTKLLTSTNQLSNLTKTAVKKTKGVVYQRNGEYYAKWTTIPAKLISEFQALKECPVQVYREMRQAAISNAEKLTHDYAVKLIRRYREALPDDTARQIVKEYLGKRLEELGKLADKDIYTRAILLKFMAAVMSEEDAYTIECYLEANSRSVPMREMANGVLKNRMQNLLRQSTNKPSEQLLPLNPTNRQHQLLHKLAVEEKALPKSMRAPPVKRPFNKAFGNKNGGKQQNSRHKRNNNSFNGSFNNSFQSSANAAGNQKTTNKQFAGAQRPNRNGNGNRNNGNNGGRGQFNNNSNNNNNNASKLSLVQQPASSSAEAVDQLQKSYDYSKIADKLDHFGNTTADVQLMLQHQLVQRSIDIAPNPKKQPKTESLES